MKGCDLIARAKTGTGKTLAFGIPIIRHIVNENEANQDGRSALFVLFSFEASHLGVSPRVCNVIDRFWTVVALDLFSCCGFELWCMNLAVFLFQNWSIMMLLGLDCELIT
jgi:hypothetical protein